MRGRSCPRKPKGSKRATVLVAGLALVLVGGRALAASGAFEELMPAAPFLYVAVHNFPELREKIKALPQYKLLSEPEMQQYKAKIEEALQEPKSTLAQAMGHDPAELAKTLGGQICLGMLPPEQGEKASVLMLADVTGDPALAASSLENLITYLRRERADRVKVTESDFRGHTVYQFEHVPQAEAPEQGTQSAPRQGGPPQDEVRRNPAYIALSDGILALSVGPDSSFLEKHLVLRGGGEVPAMAEVASFKRLQGPMGAERDLTLYADFKAFTSEGSVLQPDIDATAGSGEVGSFGLGVAFREEGVAGQGLLVAPAPRGGLLRALVPQHGDVMPPAFVDEEVGAFAGLHFSIPILYEEVMARLQRDRPQQYMAVQQVLQRYPVDIENSIIGALGNRWFLYMPADSAADESTPSAALSVDLEDSAAFAGAWGQLLMQLPASMQYETIDFMGQGIYQFMAPPGPQQPPQPGPCLTILPDKVVYTTDIEMAKAVIRDDRRASSPLLTSSDFQQMLTRTMDGPHGILLVDGRVMARWWARAAEEQIAAAGTLAQGLQPPPGMEGLSPEALLEHLPPWELMEKYESPSLLTVGWTDEGLLVQSWSP
ncbi:MAG: hypothetical protein ACYS8K_09585, partial [Planctomycetota bacterium]